MVANPTPKHGPNPDPSHNLPKYKLYVAVWQYYRAIQTDC